MGLINWMMHRNMQKDAEGLVEWAATAYHTIRSQQPTMSERDVLGSILDQRGSFPGGDEARNKVLDRYGSSLYGLCYFLGLNSPHMKRMMVSRCVQFTQHVDAELARGGFAKPPDDVRRAYFKTLGLPEDSVNENQL